MTKRILLTLLQFAAFLGLMFFGGNWDILRFTQEMRAMTTGATVWNPIPTIKFPLGASHVLIADGIVFALALLVVILIIEAIAKKLRPWAGLSVLALVLALAAYAIALATHFAPGISS
jgi:hypothetical protein